LHCSGEARGLSGYLGRRPVARIGYTAAEPELIAALCDRHEGVLPKARVFEFKLADSSQVIRGKISPTVGDAEALNRELHRPTVIKVMVTRVGSGRPRYLLLEAPSAAPTT